jgi:hypothetical protein
MISIIPGYRNRNLLVKWINSHWHHTCVYMGTVLFPFSYIVEQSKAPHSVSQSSSSYVFLFSRVTHREYREVRHPYSVSQYCTQMTCARVHLSTYGNSMEILSLPNEPNKIESGACTHTQDELGGIFLNASPGVVPIPLSWKVSYS